MKFKLGPAKPRFPWAMWYWTTASESLFDMDKITLYTFRLLIDEAIKYRGGAS